MLIIFQVVRQLFCILGQFRPLGNKEVVLKESPIIPSAASIWLRKSFSVFWEMIMEV